MHRDQESEIADYDERQENPRTQEVMAAAGDPYFKCDYTGTRYGYYAVELDSKKSKKEGSRR